MPRRIARMTLLFTACAILLASRILMAGAHPAQQSGTAHILTLHPARGSATDLEITGLPTRPKAFLTYADLASLPQVSTTIADNPDFPGLTVHLTGVPLETLALALGAPASSDLIVAECTDLYRSHYPADSIATHHPILVLKIEGQPTAAWSARAHRKDPGPYLISYNNFKPAFRVLAHADAPQIPINVTLLHFTTTAQTFDPLAPPAETPADSPIRQGFTIARQNCLRCHAQGVSGGHKSPLDWSMLSAIARGNPTFFAAYVRNPQSRIPSATMEPNPEYDDATLSSLAAYFQSLPSGAAAK